MRILIADSDLYSHEILSRVLDKYHFEVHVAADCRQAVRLLARRAFDWLLLSTDLPGGEALEILGIINAESVRTLVLVPPEAPPHTRMQARALGAFDALRKPLPIRHLVNRLLSAVFEVDGTAVLPDP